MRRLLTATAITAALIAAPAMADTLMSFEEFLGSDAAPVATFYTGITFESGVGGSDWLARDATSNNYNISSTNGGEWLAGTYWINGFVGATTGLDPTGDEGIIRFDDANATYVELDYCAADMFYLEAYDAGDNLIDVDSGPANRRYFEGNETGPGTLRVDWNGTDAIAYVIVHDAGNFWVVDDIKTDATGIIIDPTPGAALLGVIGLALVGLIRRR